MCAKLRNYKLLLLLLGLSGAHSIIQIGLYLQVNTLLVIYKSPYNSINATALYVKLHQNISFNQQNLIGVKLEITFEPYGKSQNGRLLKIYTIGNKNKFLFFLPCKNG